MNQSENLHFGVGHMCAGCEISNHLHSGCIVSRNVKIIEKHEDKKPKIEELKKTK